MSIAYIYSNNKESKPNIYLNITNKCRNNCIFCLKNFSDYLGDEKLKLEREPSFNELWDNLEKLASNNDFNEFVFCGFGEPLQRLNEIVIPLSRKIREFYKNKIRVDTNGQANLFSYTKDMNGNYRRLENVPEELFKSCVDKVSVSLNAENPEKYFILCKPVFPKRSREEVFNNVLKFIRQSSSAGLETEVSALEFALDKLPAEYHPDLEETEELAKSCGADSFRIRCYNGDDLRVRF